MTFVNRATTTVTVTLKVTDAFHDANLTPASSLAVEIKKGTSTTLFNPATATYTGSAGVWVLNIPSVPCGGTAATDDGLYTISVKQYNNVDTDAATIVTELGKTIFNKVLADTTVACY